MNRSPSSAEVVGIFCRDGGMLDRHAEVDALTTLGNTLSSDSLGGAWKDGSLCFRRVSRVMSIQISDMIGDTSYYPLRIWKRRVGLAGYDRNLRKSRYGLDMGDDSREPVGGGLSIVAVLSGGLVSRPISDGVAPSRPRGDLARFGGKRIWVML